MCEMPRGPRLQQKDNPRKRGKKSFVENASLPRHAGFKKRVQFRKNQKKAKPTMRRYRTHFKLAFTLEGPYIARSIKCLGPPGSYDPKNQHGSVMPSLPGDFRLSDLQAGKLFLNIAQHDISYDQLRGVSGMLSYLYAIKTGKSGENFPEVKSVLEGYTEGDFKKSKTLIPESIPSPEMLREDFKFVFFRLRHSNWSLIQRFN